METINAALELNRAISPLAPQVKIAVTVAALFIKSLKKG